MPFFKKSKQSQLAKIVRPKPVVLLVGWALRAFANTLFATLRVEYRGLDNIPKKGIIALWHNALTVIPLIPIRLQDQLFSVVVSKSRDGQFLSAYLHTYPNIRVVQVGHQTRHAALLQIVEELEQDRVIMITPDGPRGPAFRVKPGTCFSAKQTESPIVAMQWHASKVYTFNTWDKLRLPRFFSKVVITFNEPIHPDEINEEKLTDALATQVHF